MTVTTLNIRRDFDGNDTATQFDFSFPYFLASEIKVVQVDDQQVEKVLVRGDDYSLPDKRSPNGNTVTLLKGALPTGYKLSIIREVDATQQTKLRDMGAYKPENIEFPLDKLTMLVQQLIYTDTKSMKLNFLETEWDTQGKPIDQVTSKAGDIDAITSKSISSETASTASLVVSSTASLKGFSGALDGALNASNHRLINLPAASDSKEPMRKGDAIIAGAGPSFQYVDDAITERTALSNYISNHNFISKGDPSQPTPDATPRDYAPGFQVFAGWFADDVVGVEKLTYTNGMLNETGSAGVKSGKIYTEVPKTGALEFINDFTASIANTSLNPSSVGVSFSLISGKYRIVVDLAVAADVFSVKLESGLVATKHETIDYLKSKDSLVFSTVGDLASGLNSRGEIVDFAFLSSAGFITSTNQYSKEYNKGGTRYKIKTSTDYGGTPDGFGDFYVGGGTDYVAERLNKSSVIVEEFGVIPSETVAYSANLAAIAAVMPDNCIVKFQGGETYLIDSSAGFTDPVHGVIVLNVDNKKNPKIIGKDTVIKISSHDLSSGVGLRFCNFTSCKNPLGKGFIADMTFTGVNTSSSKYPFNGLFTAFDEATGSKTQDQLNTNVIFRDIKGKIFHPFGAFATSGAPYLGDPNNGFKNFLCFASGDDLATGFANQNRQVKFIDCGTLEGHNGYGLWAWAYNSVKFIRPFSESYVTKYSDNLGNFIGSSIPLCRYHQFYCKNVSVQDVDFIGRPSDQKTSGFEGASLAVSFNQNINGASLSGGKCEVIGGSITGGNGDAANSTGDKLVFCNTYGTFSVNDIDFSSSKESGSNKISGYQVLYSPASSGGNGTGQFKVSGMSSDVNCSYYDNIVFDNSAPTASTRRAKSIEIRGLTSLSQAQYAIQEATPSLAVSGCDSFNMSNVFVSGEFNTLWDKSSPNSRSFSFKAQVGDVYKGDNVTVKDKYYSFDNSSSATLSFISIDNFNESGVTARALGKTPVFTEVGNGSPEGNIQAGVGSIYKRQDGGASTTLNIKETGSGNTGWAAK